VKKVVVPACKYAKLDSNDPPLQFGILYPPLAVHIIVPFPTLISKLASITAEIVPQFAA